MVLGAIVGGLVYVFNIPLWTRLGLLLSAEIVMENSARKLGQREELELCRRIFVPKRPQHVRAPTTYSSGRFVMRMRAAVTSVLKPIQPVLHTADERLHELWRSASTNGHHLLLRFKYALPIFQSVHYSFADLYLGQRFLASMALALMVLVLLFGGGYWLQGKIFGVLTAPYGNFIRIFGKNGQLLVDWYVAVSPDRKMLGLMQLMTIFIARTIHEGGQPFYMELLNSILSSIMVATVLTTIAVAVGLFSTVLQARQHLCLLREGRLGLDVSRLRYVDACAYVGTQMGAVLVGWGTLFLWICAGILFITWDPFRRTFVGSCLVVVVLSGALYCAAVVWARAAARSSPGIYIHFRARWALKETLLTVFHMGAGLFEVSFRLFLGGLRQLLSWFWLQNRTHDSSDDQPPGTAHYLAGMYLLHRHNSPAVRVLVERLHRELRNKAVLANFPMDNLEPTVIKREAEDMATQRTYRRHVARIMLMLLLRINAARHLEARRKHALHATPRAPDAKQLKESTNSGPLFVERQ